MIKFWQWNISHWRIETWTLIVALVALAQPWIIALWRRFFRAGAVDICESALIEVGYSGFGPTIGLVGTLRSRDRDSFIQSAHLTFMNQGSKSERRLDWAVFRTSKTTVSTTIAQSGEVALDIPTSFMISTLEPHPYNILFRDTALFREMLPGLTALKQSWLSYLQQDVNITSLAPPHDPASERKLNLSLRRSYDRFSATSEFSRIQSELTRLYYWDQGAYSLTLHIQTAHPNRQYIKTWSFSLLDSDIEALRQNISKIMEEMCGFPLPLGQYNFIFATYD